MKRAWPYALALAVVVTGCYLALAPLLRSLSPAPTTSSSPLSQNSAVVTVGKSKFVFRSHATGSTGFVSNLTTKKKTAKKAKKVAPSTTTTGTPAQSSTGNSGFAGTASPSSSTPSTSSGSSAPTKKTPTKTASKKRTASVGGGIDQTQADNGFASPTGSGTVTGGQTLAPGN